ncbi:hypothetical protein XENORESO_021458, partial [Xenotaenia resolanae]
GNAATLLGHKMVENVQIPSSWSIIEAAGRQFPYKLPIDTYGWTHRRRLEALNL